jgi:ABC-type Fe3+/spermidine/putrescine transport system ATPase subunit
MTLTIDLTTTFTAPGAEPFTIDGAFDVEAGETLVVLGPSGSGKTLLLESVAGFHSHNGSIMNGDSDLASLSPEDRDFGFVFQDYALFPHMTVEENVMFGERYRDETRDFDALLAELDIIDLVDRNPPTLSGGEKQRVALARALYCCPDVLLLDEPLASLDVPTQQALRDELAEVLADMTAVYITHNRTTARALADRIAVMSDGEIIQTGPPEAVFEHPVSPFVARFTGANCIPLSVLPHRTIEDATTLVIRPEHVQLAPGNHDFTATVRRVIREDATNRVSLSVGASAHAHTETRPRSDGSGATLDAFSTDPPAVGETIPISLPDEHVTLL